MEYGRLLSYSLREQSIILDFEKKCGMIECVTDKIIRVCELSAKEISSKAIEGKKQKSIEINASMDHQNGLTIETESLQIIVRDEFQVECYDRKGNIICKDYSGERTLLKEIDPEMVQFMAKEGHQFQGDGQSHKIQVVKQLMGDEKFYGLGDKTGFLNKKGYEYMMWNTDNPAPHVDSFQALYKSIPFFITLREACVYGIFFDNTMRTYFDMGKESSDYYWFGADHGALDYYFIAGDDMKEVLSGYTYLTGTAPLPQLWTLGYHQSRWGYNTAEQIIDVSEKMNKYDIPCDAIHWDIAYMDHYKVFTTDKEKVPDLQSVVDTLKERGRKLVTIIDPGVKKEEGYSVYEEGVKNHYFAQTPDQEIYENVVWPGTSVYPDFGRREVREWWGRNHKVLLDAGVRGIWNDMNEPASFHGELPDDVVFYDEERKTDHAEMHNVYGHNMARATYEGLETYDQRRPFVITRACYSGSQKYTIAWTGDNQSLWAHLQMAIPQLCNLGLSGMPIVGTDIGGFGADTTAELLCRWIQVGCFSPFCRNHSSLGTRAQEPWAFDQATLDIYRKYVELRYKLLPYFYDQFFLEEQTGLPIMRPLVLNYPYDREVTDMNDQFMIGNQIVVSPVVVQGAVHKMVYLPEGTWYDYWTDEKLQGNTWLVRKAELDTCPIYVKAGSIIPTMLPCNSVDERDKETLILQVYEGSGEMLHYQDDGETFCYKNGEYNLYKCAIKNGVFEMKMLKGGYPVWYSSVIVEYHNGEEVKTIQCEVKKNEKDANSMESIILRLGV